MVYPIIAPSRHATFALPLGGPEPPTPEQESRMRELTRQNCNYPFKDDSRPALACNGNCPTHGPDLCSYTFPHR